MNEIFGYIAVTVIFLTGIVPMLIGIRHYLRENRKLDRARRPGEKGSPHQEKFASH